MYIFIYFDLAIFTFWINYLINNFFLFLLEGEILGGMFTGSRLRGGGRELFMCSNVVKKNKNKERERERICMQMNLLYVHFSIQNWSQKTKQAV